MANRLILALAMLFSLVLVACTPAGIQEDDPCTGFVCPENSYCEEAQCLCDEGFKVCNAACVPNEQCCSNSDCPSGECLAGQCIIEENIPTVTEQKEQEEQEKVEEEKTKPLSCESNKEQKGNSCVCREGYKWCRYQDKCIPERSCCADFECSDRKICRDTFNTVDVCLQKEIKICNKVWGGASKFFDFDSGRYEVSAEDLHYFDHATITVKGTEVTKSFEEAIRGKEYTVQPSFKMFIQQFDISGGGCDFKDEDERN